MWPINCSFGTKEACTDFCGVYCTGSNEPEWSR